MWLILYTGGGGMWRPLSRLFYSHKEDCDKQAAHLTEQGRLFRFLVVPAEGLDITLMLLNGKPR